MTEQLIKADLFFTLSWSLGFDFAPNLPVIYEDKKTVKLIAWRNLCKTWTALSGCNFSGWSTFPKNLIEWEHFLSYMTEHYSAQVVVTVYSVLGRIYKQGLSLVFPNEESLSRFCLTWT